MNKEEAEKILQEQFKLLNEISKTCEPECLKDLTDSMLGIYATLYPIL